MKVNDTAQGNVNSATSITGTLTGTPSGTFTVAPYSPLSGSPVTLSGAMKGNIKGFIDALSLTFSSNGSFTGTDSYDPQLPGCEVNGTLTQQGTSNIFDITYKLGPGDCSSVALTGIAFESNTDYFSFNGGAATTYLYAILLTSTSTQVRPYVVVVYQ